MTVWRFSARGSASPALAYTALTLTAFFLAGNHIIGRAVRDQVPPVGLSFWRWIAGLLILLPFALPGLRRQARLLSRQLPLVALLGALLIGSSTLILVALTRTFAINVSLINAVLPTLTVFFAWLLLGEPLNRWRVLGVVSGIAGIVIMVTRGDLWALANLDLHFGDFLALLAMVGFAGYALNLGRLPRELGVGAALFSISLAGTLMLLPFYLWESATVGPFPVDAVSVAAVLALAVLVTVLGNLGWYFGNRIIGPGRASLFINLIPVFGVVLAIALLNERLFAYHLVGGSLVVTGLLLAAGSHGSGKTAV